MTIHDHRFADNSKAVLWLAAMFIVLLIFMVGRAYDQSTTVGLKEASVLAATYLDEEVVAIIHEDGVPRGAQLFEATSSKRKVLVFDDGTVLDISSLQDPSFFPKKSLDDKASGAVLAATSGKVEDGVNQAYSAETEELRKELRARITQRLAPVMSHNAETARAYGAGEPGAVQVQPQTPAMVMPMTDVELDDAKVKTIFERVLQNDDWAITFRAPEEKTEVIVFTDWTCPYCKRLHDSVNDLNEAGITVHYLWMPRIFGLGEEDSRVQDVVSQMRNASCSKNPQRAVDLLFNGKKLTGSGCSPEDSATIVGAIKEQYYLAFMLEIKGTPMIVTNQGKRFSGFSSAKPLIEAVNKYSDPK